MSLGTQIVLAAVLGVVGFVGTLYSQDDFIFEVLMRGSILFLAIHAIRHLLGLGKVKE